MSVSINAISSIPGTGNQVAAINGLALAKGTTGQRLLGLTGVVRFNTTTSVFEATADGVTYVTFASAAGPILSVTGTANRITVTPGPNPVIDIDVNYMGQTSITTLGTIGTGTWNATNIALGVGGTNASLVASLGGIFYSTAVAGAILAGTATARQILQSGATAAPAWSTATYPATTTINRLLYSSAANTITDLATANNGLLVTSAAGVPSILAGPATTGQILQANAAAPPSFSTASYPSTTTINQVLYSSAANIITGITAANNGTLVTSSTGVPSILAGPGITGNMLQSQAAAAPAWSTTTWPATSTINQLLYSSAANVISGLTTANSATLATTSAGIPILVALASTQVLVGTSGTPAAASIPGKNICINGDFQVWQRGAGGSATFAIPASTTQYIVDRWQVFTGANEATTVTQTAGATSGSYLCTLQRNNAQTGTTNISITSSFTRDMCIGMAGNKVTVSFKAKAGANFSAAGSLLGVFLNTGTGSTDISALTGFTGSANPILTTQAITTTLTQYSITSTAATGATVTQAAIQFYFTPVGTAGVDDSFSITDVQVEISPAATPFERLGFDQQLARCQKFYWKSFNYSVAPATNAGTNKGELVMMVTRLAALAMTWGPQILPVVMFSVPTFTTYNPSAANAQIRDLTAAADMSATGVGSEQGTKSFYIQGTGNAGGAIGNIAAVQITAEAELV